MVATARGTQSYLAGDDQRTVKLPFGELRRHGSYVVAPPSIHPTGKLYTWLVEPTGPLRPVPPAVLSGVVSAGAGRGDYDAPARKLAEGDGRHDFLVGIAVHLVRGGICDERMITALLRAAFEVGCEQDPPARSGEFEQIARWAANSRIAERERRGLA
jgi:hypothetical protein